MSECHNCGWTTGLVNAHTKFCGKCDRAFYVGYKYAMRELEERATL
jgi:hypothetical protein